MKRILVLLIPLLFACSQVETPAQDVNLEPAATDYSRALRMQKNVDNKGWSGPYYDLGTRASTWGIRMNEFAYIRANVPRAEAKYCFMFVDGVQRVAWNCRNWSGSTGIKERLGKRRIDIHAFRDSQRKRWAGAWRFDVQPR